MHIPHKDADAREQMAAVIHRIQATSSLRPTSPPQRTSRAVHLKGGERRYRRREDKWPTSCGNDRLARKEPCGYVHRQRLGIATLRTARLLQTNVD